MSPDRLSGSIVNPQSLNLYSYVDDDPTNLRDALGLCPGTTDAAPDLCPLLDWGFDASRGGGGIFGCMLDGFSTPCSLVAGALASGAAVNCPQCGPGDRVGADNLIYQGYGSLVMTCTGPTGGPFDCVPGGYAVRFIAVGAVADSSGIGIDTQWWKAFLTSFVEDFSLKGARHDGESFSQCVSRTQQDLLGTAGTTALHSTSLLSLGASVATAPNLFSQAVPFSPDLFRAEGIFGKAVFKSSFLEAAAFEAVTVHGTLPASAVGTAQRAAAAGSRVAPLITAIATGIEGGFFVACR